MSTQKISNKFRGWAAIAKSEPLQQMEFEVPELSADEVEIAVDYCGLCHSDLSMIDNEWGVSRYPFVPGHEAVGRVVGLGANVRALQIGQQVGVGWHSGSCMSCGTCLEGSQHLCSKVQPTIIGHQGGFADRLRAHWAWAVPLPKGIDPSLAGPLFCGGLTVFTPLLEFDVKPTHRVGVVGIGGLGHLALRFLRAWGCEVVAITSTASKQEEALQLGAHRVVVSNDTTAMASLACSLDMVLVTASASLNWDALIASLRANGRMHVVGMPLDAIPVRAMSLIRLQRSISGSPTGSPTTLATMLEFCARHSIAPQVEHFPMSDINTALHHLREGKARYRVVLCNNDLRGGNH